MFGWQRKEVPLSRPRFARAPSPASGRGESARVAERPAHTVNQSLPPEPARPLLFLNHSRTKRRRDARQIATFRNSDGPD